MLKNDAAEQYREYLGIEKGHVDEVDEVVDDVCPEECESTNHEGYTHEQFEAEVAAPDAEPEVEDEPEDVEPEPEVED